MLFAVEINAEEEAVRASIEPKLAYYNSILKNVRREIVFLYHNNEFNPNHTNNLHQNEWQKRLNLFDKSHINIDFAYSDSSRYIYPNELSLYRIRHQLNVLSPSHFHHCLIPIFSTSPPTSVVSLAGSRTPPSASSSAAALRAAGATWASSRP